MPIEALLGKEVVDRGLTQDQINLLLLASESVSAKDIADDSLAFASVMGGNEAQKHINKAMNKKTTALKAELVRKTYGK